MTKIGDLLEYTFLHTGQVVYYIAIAEPDSGGFVEIVRFYPSLYRQNQWCGHRLVSDMTVLQSDASSLGK